MAEKTTLPVVFVVSDSIGETAEFVVRAALIQFDVGEIEFRRVPYVSKEEDIKSIVEEAKNKNALITFTLVIPQLRDMLANYAAQHNVPLVDILGPMLDALAKILPSSVEPHNEAGLIRRLDEEYFRKVEAIEFAVKYDDGKDPRGLLHADIALIGVSRSSKTPLSMYMAHKLIKVANVPLVPEIKPPDELYQIPRHKVIGLTIDPEKLYEIRKERLKALGLRANADYANMERIIEELNYAEEIMRKVGCPIIDVSTRAVEETAGKILEIYYRNKTREKVSN